MTAVAWATSPNPLAEGQVLASVALVPSAAEAVAWRLEPLRPVAGGLEVEAVEQAAVEAGAYRQSRPRSEP